ncbi:MAG: hypothetical protein A2V64_13505 [Bacteroidetes bacterium RBG_13_43_22]|nr:MAG: hypothetical protein A2V64_13505 [Bacteroidetes bacterium RBG_13_43_22]
MVNSLTIKTTRLILFFILTGAMSVPSCEPDKKMAVETGEVANILTTTADVSGTVIDVGEGATQHGHCYGTTAGPLITGTKTSLGTAVPGDFTSSLTGLEPETKYYVRAYCSLDGEAAYGSEITFTTASAVPPEVTTTEISGITKTSAVSGGNVTSAGGTTVTARGVCWNTSAGPTTSNSKTTDDSGTGSYTSNITGLTAGTKYYVRAYATNSGGTAYGNELNFTTNPEVVLVPTVTTAAVNLVTVNSAVSGGEVTNDGGAAVSAKGVCWSTSANPTITNSKTNEGAGTGIFVSNLTGLLPGTLYYIRAYATNSTGTSYGNEYSFTTGAIVPTVTTIPATSVTATTASSGGDVTSNGGSTVIARGVCWNTSQNPTIDGSHTSDGPGTGIYSSSIIGLTGNTTYYIRAYATNSAGTGYGNELTFKTSPVVPTITTTEITDITATTASSGGNITSDGGASITARGVCWSTAVNPTTADTKTDEGTGGGSFTSSITGLSPGTTYHVRAYATNSKGTAYGTDITFTAGAVLPVLTTTAISAITATTATSGGNISSDGGSAVTARGVCWSTSENPTTADPKTSDGSGTGSFTSSITGLTYGTTYHVRAYATCSAGTAYGQDITFTAGSVPPAVTTTAISEITSTTAASGGDVTSDGGAEVTTRGVCWSTNTNPTTADSKSTDASGTGSYISSITGLTPCTTYHVRAYATNSAGTGYGEDVSFATGTSLATVTTTAISAITSTTASSGGNITGSCASTVTERGVCWSTAANPTTADQKTSDGTGVGLYTSSITGLTNGTSYHVRAYATNSTGTAYGEDVAFTAGAIAPTVTTTAISDITSTTSSSGGDVTSDGGSSVTARGVCWSTSADPTTADSKTSDASGTGTFSSTLTGLTPCTTYHVRAYATNSVGTSYGDDVSFTSGTSLATVTTATISAITTTTASSGGNITGDCASSVTARGVCWSTSSNPTTADSKTADDTGGGSYTSSITGLTNSTSYHVRAYATNSAGTAYGEDITFTAGAVPPTVTTTAISDIMSTTASSGGDVTSDGGSSVTVRGVCWSTSSNPTTTDSKTSDGTGTGTFTSSLTGLTPNTTFYVKAYATNSAGTAYGNEVTFTTTIQLIDYDGNSYNTVQIGTQLWMQENLKVTHYSNGDAIPNVTDNAAWLTLTSGAFCWYDNDEATYKATYGALYNYHTTVDNRNLCPTGWHVPTDTEWTTLTDYLGGESVAGGKLKETGTTNWLSPNTGATNESGYTALPGGYRDDPAGSFNGIRLVGKWWSSSENDKDYAWTRYIAYNAVNSSRYLFDKRNGLSVRCLQGEGPILPAIITSSISDITTISATGGGNITSDGGASVTARGTCWSTSANPTTADSKTSDGTGAGSFISSIAGLSSGTTYHVRAYAISSVGTVYGEDVSFTTAAAPVIPTVTTTAVSAIATTTAISGGNITSDGGASVTSRGVCWNTSANPTIANSKTSDGTGTGSFVSNLTGLTGNTPYYVRAYATNSVGTAYGNEVTFTTTSSVTDYDGNIYNTVQIGTQLWMHENLKVTHYRNGDVIAYVTDPTAWSNLTSGAYCWYNNDEATYKANYGALYNYYATVDNRNLCPVGWHVPTDAEWTTLTSYLGGESTSGGKLKETGTTHWDSPNTGATNVSGFTALPGGCRSIAGGFVVMGSKAYIWSSTGLVNFDAWYRLLYSDDPSVSRLSASSKPGGYSVRCLQGEGQVLPGITTSSISDITTTSATSGGNITSDGGASVTARGVCWSTSPGPTTANSKTTDGSGTGSFSSSLSGLNPGTLYYVRAYATNSVGTVYGNEQSFTTSTTTPTLTTNVITSITTTTASSGGNITSDGGVSVTVRGVCWSTSTSPTTSNSKTTDGSGTGSFTSSLTGLTANTTYYVRAYATNSVGTIYGDEFIFTTLATVTTTSISNILATSASSGGSVTAGGNGSITARGVCWNTSTNPTTANSKTTDGTGTGSFTSTLTGLQSHTTYYVRAYATNGGGTAYGNELSFTTLCVNTINTTHNAGDVAPVTKSVSYEIVQTNLSGGDKCWIARNLGADNQAGSATDDTEASAGWYWQFNRKQGYKHDGATRTPNTTWITSIDEASDWTAANDPCTILLGTGWRIPTRAEWTNADNNGGWGNYNDTYSSVLKLHAAGFLKFEDGSLNYRGYSGSYWSSTETDNIYGWYQWFYEYASYISTLEEKSKGLPLRCLKD